MKSFPNGFQEARWGCEIIFDSADFLGLRTFSRTSCTAWLSAPRCSSGVSQPRGPRRPRGRTCGPPVRTRAGPTFCPQSLLAQVPKFWETGFMRGRGSSRPGVSGLDGVMSEFRVLYRNSDIDVGIQSLDYINELSKPACSMPWDRLRPWSDVQRERACVSRSRPDRVQHGAGRPHPPS